MLCLLKHVQASKLMGILYSQELRDFGMLIFSLNFMEVPENIQNSLLEHVQIGFQPRWKDQLTNVKHRLSEEFGS